MRAAGEEARVSWIRGIVAVAIVATFWQLATEWTAWRLAWQPQLGAAWMNLGEIRLYPPWRFLIWWLAYGAYAPRLFDAGGLIAGAGGMAAMILALATGVLARRKSAADKTFGSARWAHRREVERAGLLGVRGVVLARLGEHLVRDDGDRHVLCLAPTRSGKGVGLVIPTLLTWPSSVLVHDIKGENWSQTAGWRAELGPVFKFDPTDPRCDAYNPLMEVRLGTEEEVRDAQNIADILVDPQGAAERRDHWQLTSQALLVGAILHVLYAEPDKSLGGVLSFLSRGPSFEETLRAMIATPHKDGAPHPVVAEIALGVLNKSPDERSGVLSTATSFLELFRDPIVREATSRCDWRISALVDDSSPVSLYLVVPPSDISRTRPLVRLILNQIGRRLTEDLAARQGSRRLLMLLDEFPVLGRLDFFQTSLAYMAGFGLKAVLIAQSLTQLEDAYGRNQQIVANCSTRVVFSTNDERTARWISDGLGERTELRASTSYAEAGLGSGARRVSTSRQEVARSLLTPAEVMQLPPDEAIILVNGGAPIRAKKMRYFEDLRFLRRVLPPPAKSKARADGAGEVRRSSRDDPEDARIDRDGQGWPPAGMGPESS